VKCHPEIRYTETENVNELGTKKRQCVKVRKGIRSCLSDCSLKTGRLIHKCNVLL
jgi:hypothetical protein